MVLVWTMGDVVRDKGGRWERASRYGLDSVVGTDGSGGRTNAEWEYGGVLAVHGPGKQVWSGPSTPGKYLRALM